MKQSSSDLSEHLSGTIRQKGEQMRERRTAMEQQMKQQMGEVRARLDDNLTKAQTAKFRQLRHLVCFCLSMLDVVITAFWVGASPQTFHFYYTLKCFTLGLIRAVWYRCHGWHYFLYDLCYFSNLVLFIFLWVLPKNEQLFLGAYGFNGVLLISVPLFRNSFVPHSLDRVTSVIIHIAPALQLWVLRWYCKDRSTYFSIPEHVSVLPALGLYFVWCIGYYTYQFGIMRERIQRKGYATLYQHMAFDMGLLKLAPKYLQSPVRSRLLFMLGHLSLFAAGLPFMYFNFWAQTCVLLVAILWAFKNGASFYIMYFWKVYDNQIHAFERQLESVQAESDAHEALHAADSMIESEADGSEHSLQSKESKESLCDECKD